MLHENVTKKLASSTEDDFVSLDVLVIITDKSDIGQGIIIKQFLEGLHGM
jgi:hypothetical protein